METNPQQVFDPGQQGSKLPSDNEPQIDNSGYEPLSESVFLLPDDDLDEVYFNEEKEEVKNKRFSWHWK